MAKTITARQRTDISKDLTSRIVRSLGCEIDELEYGYGDRSLNSLQESILWTISSYVDAIVRKALADWEIEFERDENSKVTKLTQENKALKKELKEFQAIKTLLEDARSEA